MKGGLATVCYRRRAARSGSGEGGGLEEHWEKAGIPRPLHLDHGPGGGVGWVGGIGWEWWHFVWVPRVSGRGPMGERRLFWNGVLGGPARRVMPLERPARRVMPLEPPAERGGFMFGG